MSDDTQQRPIYKNVAVRPRMLDVGEWKTIRRRVGTKKVIKSMGIFNKKEVEVDEPIYESERQWISTGKQSDVQIDLENFGQQIEDACNALYSEGYTVISITGVLRGNYQYKEQQGKIQKGNGYLGHAFGFGYSVTDGVVIIGKLM